MGVNLKDELHNVISGKSQVRYGRIIQTIASYLDQGKRTGPKAEISKQDKSQEAEKLALYIEQNNLWVEIDLNQYVSEGNNRFRSGSKFSVTKWISEYEEQ